MVISRSGFAGEGKNHETGMVSNWVSTIQLTGSELEIHGNWRLIEARRMLSRGSAHHQP